MPLSVPKFLKKAFAASGGKTDVPITGADINNGRADYENGFPPVTRAPIAAGGVPPYGTDMNGVLFDLSSGLQYLQAGLVYPYNQDFASAIGGYPVGAVVSAIGDSSIKYRSIVANNTTTPPSAGWVNADVPEASNSEISAGVIAGKYISPKGLKDSGLWPLGVGQTWQNVSASRVANTNYTNSTGRPIAVFASLGTSSVQTTRIVVGGVIAGQWIASGPTTTQGAFAIVPPGSIYQVTNFQGGSIVDIWSELR